MQLVDDPLRTRSCPAAPSSDGDVKIRERDTRGADGEVPFQPPLVLTGVYRDI